MSSPETLAAFLLHGKCLRAKIPQLIRLVSDMLRAPRLGPAERVRQILLEEKANEESELIHRGDRIVTLRLRAALSSIERPIEEMGGVNYLHALRRLESMEPEDLRARLLNLHRRIIRRSGLKIHLGGDAECIADARTFCSHLIDAVAAGEALSAAPWPELSSLRAEGLVVSSPVHFVGLASRLHVEGDELHAAMNISKRLLCTDYLWENVRMKGGAYGVSWTFNYGAGHCFFSSYRDPHVEQTLDIYRRSADWLCTLDLSRTALEQVKIGTLGAEPPRKPSRDTYQAFYHHLIHLTHERRLRRWEQMRATTLADLRACGENLRAALQRETWISVLGGRSGLRNSGTPLELIDVLT